MTRWSREPYLLVLACIGAALVVFVLGVSVVLAAGHSVPVALWAVGGAAVGILAGVLLPRSGSADGTSDSPTPEDPTPPDEDGEQPLVAGSADTEGEDDAEHRPRSREPSTRRRREPSRRQSSARTRGPHRRLRDRRPHRRPHRLRQHRRSRRRQWNLRPRRRDGRRGSLSCWPRLRSSASRSADSSTAG